MKTAEKLDSFYLGKKYDAVSGKVQDDKINYPSKNLTTHAVCVGMTGSGKTGLAISLLEDAALDSIPSIIIDPKGDMANMLLTFPNLSPEEFKPWIDASEAEKKGKSLDDYAKEVAKTWENGLKASDETQNRIQELRNSVDMEIYTPASKAGIPLSVLSSFKAPPKELILDNDAMRERVLSTASSILALLGISGDPIKSREHILISTIIDDTWREGKDIDLPYLIQQVQEPKFSKIGALDTNTFFPPRDRKALSVTLNNLLASPGFKSWMEGAPLDIDELLYTESNKPKVSVISIAHLGDSERMFFVTLFLNQLISWMRKQPGTSSLKAIFYMDEIFGYFPPTASPPSKLPMITLLKQARAYGLGIFLATQNPVDLDYKGLSNCGTWFIGRLQTSRDKARVVEGLAAASNGEIDTKALDKLMSELGSRVFIMRSIYEKNPVLFQTRFTMSYLRGPLTLNQIEMLTKNMKKDFSGDKISNKNDKKEKNDLRPIIPQNIKEYFVKPPANTSQVSYKPMLVGFSKLHFVEKKYSVDDWINSSLAVDVDVHEAVNWEKAEKIDDLQSKLLKEPPENAIYDDVPLELLQDKNYQTYKKDLTAFLYQTDTLKVFEYKPLNLISTAKDSEEDFRSKIALTLKEKNDELVKKIKDQFEIKILKLQEKINKIKDKKDEQSGKSFYQKISAFLSLITTIIGAVFSRKLTQSTINQAGTTFRRIGRIGKDSQGLTIVEENLQILEQQLEDTKSAMQEEMAKVSNVDVNKLPLDEVVIRPKKTDITIDQVAILWWPK